MSNSKSINSYAEYMTLNKPDKVIVLSEELNQHNVNELAEIWNCKPSNIYDSRRNLGIPRPEFFKGASEINRPGANDDTDSDSDLEEPKAKRVYTHKTPKVPFPDPIPQAPKINMDMSVELINKTIAQTLKKIMQEIRDEQKLEDSRKICLHQLRGDYTGEYIIENIMRFAEILSKDSNYNLIFEIKEI